MIKNPLQKRMLLLSIVLLSVRLNINAQKNEQLINDYLKQEQQKNGWLPGDINDWYQSDYYTDETSGLSYAYINQRYHNIIVFNAVSVFAIKNNKVVHFTPDLIDRIENKINSDKPAISPEDAIRFALQNINGKELSSAKLVSKDDRLNIYSFDVPDFSDHTIIVQLVYQPTENSILLAWNVSIAMKNNSDWWNVRIDALTGNFIEKNNYTVECNFVSSKETVHHAEELFDPSPAFPEPMPSPAPLPPPVVPVYNIYPLPFEAPSFGLRQMLNDPSDVVASPYGWHDVDGVSGAEYTITNGNNVYAATDVDANNVPDYSPDGGSSLDFNFTITQNTTPITNKDASVTNLFYMNNKLHDLLYHFGFDEVAGNFQQNNYGHGGLGNDQVKADAFDGSGTNNANFATPVDGSAPRMQMYLWNGSPYQYDASFDNGVIAHEYGHGLSNRLTGGPANSNCLDNAEQAGEGWSDYLALMMTIEPWDDGADSRGIGTYVIGQSPTGAGIRRRPYSTNMSINPLEYGNMGNSGTSSYGIAKSTEVHNIGEIWCSAVWDMTWNLIDDLGFDNTWTNAASGNYIALRLVVQGMKLQPCSPGFLNSRNAILAADTLLYGGVHSCRIWQAFARRGMGYNAVQGSSSSATDQTAGFSLPPACNTAPVAAFKTNVSSLSCGNTVIFTDKSQLATSYLWNFGDNTTSTSANPTHTYASAGTYNVKLVVTNANGNDSVIHTIVNAQNPVAAFYMVDSAIFENEYVVFKNQSTGACSYFMDFGDNNTAANFASSHTYTTPGNYNVKLVVTNPSGSDSVTHSVHVDTLHINASFFSDKSTINCGSTISFTNTSAQSTSWLWNFGDQTTSSSQNPSHQYPYPGTYLVKLIVYNNFESDSTIHTIIVLPAFTATASATPTTICAGNQVQLNVINSATSNMQYALTSISYAPVAGAGTAVTLTDDQLSAFLSIGFTFHYDVADYTQFKICSNGYITFNSSANATGNAISAIPNTASPNNFIGVAFGDLNPANPGSSINYFTTGIAPTRKLVVNYNTSYFNNASKPAVAQIVLYEGTNIIEFHIDTICVPDASQSTTQGIENLGGTSGITLPGRNKTVFNINNEGWRFTPAIFSYTWTPGNLNGAAQTVFPISSGSYTVTVGDGTGCLLPVTSPSITVNAPNPTISGNLSFCPGNSTILNAGVFTGYNWSTGATTQTIPVNTSGTFTVTVTNGSGCTGSTQATTTINPNPTPTISGSTSFCTGSSATLNAGAGYSGYSWSTGATTQTISPNTIGTFTVTVTNANGCSGSTQATTSINPNPTPSISGNTSFCSGSSTTLDAGVFSGYNWSTGATTQTISVNTAGTFTVTVTNANGCTGSVSVTTIMNQMVTWYLDADNDGYFVSSQQSCGSPGIGWTLVVTGSSDCNDTNAAAYPGHVEICGNGIDDNCNGSIDEGCCTATISGTSANITCNGLNNGSINMTASGGMAPYTYQWDNGATTQNRSNLAVGTYTVTVTYALSCTQSNSFTITQPTAMVLAATLTNVKCNGSSTGSATVGVSGGTPPYSYKWNTIAAQTTQTITGLAAGIYICNVQDSKNCKKVINVTITQPAVLGISITASNVTVFSGNNGTASADPSGGTIPYTYLWSNSKITKTISGLIAGTYTVTVTDAKVCTKSTSVIITQPPPRMDLTMANDLTDFALFPNPTTGVVTVTFYSASENSCTIKLSDLAGRVMYSSDAKVAKGDNVKRFDFSSLSTGIYFMQWSSGDKQKIVKVVKE